MSSYDVTNSQYSQTFSRNAPMSKATEAQRTVTEDLNAGLQLQLEPEPARDIVQISDEGREKLYSAQPGKTEAEKKALTDSVRANLDKLTASRKDLNGHIDAILKKNGIRLDESEKMRVETTMDGRIVVGGIKDKTKRKAIEAALNKEQGLSKKIMEHKTAERKLNSALKYETGKTLGGLIAELNGDEYQGATDAIPNIRIDPKDDLGHYEFFAENGDFVDMLRELSTESQISIMAESSPNAEPEKTLVDAMRATRNQIAAGLEEANRKFIDEMTENGVTMSHEEMAEYMLSLTNVTLRVGSDNTVEIEGDLCKNSRRDEAFKESVEKQLKNMMEQKDETGEVVLFEEASERLLDDYQEKFGPDAATDAMIKVEIGKSNPGGAVRLSSPSKEEELREDINKEVTIRLAELGVESDTPFEVNVDKNGKLTVANLPTDTLEREKVLHAMEIINTNVLANDEEDPVYGELTSLVNHTKIFRYGGTGEIYKDIPKVTEVTITQYKPETINPEVLRP